MINKLKNYKTVAIMLTARIDKLLKEGKSPKGIFDENPDLKSWYDSVNWN